MKIGQRLIQKGFITPEKLEDALLIQSKTGSRLGRILVGKGYVKQRDIDKLMAEYFNLPFKEISTEDVDTDNIKREDFDLYLEKNLLPLKNNMMAICEPQYEQISFIESNFKEYEIIVTSQDSLKQALHLHFGGKLSHESIYSLANTYPEYSAAQVFISKQLIGIYCIAILFAYLVFYSTDTTFLTINIITTFFLIISFIFKFSLTWIGSDNSFEKKVTDEEVNNLDESSLPAYTVLIPMYNEPEVLPIIVNSIRNLDYPKEKLDVKLVLEENDDKTIQAAKDLELEDIFDICLVPHSFPKTKPKACNYALKFAKGKYVTIYDAEDKPEKDQLKKAIIAFKKSPKNTAVIQAKLNYYNDKENILTRCFTLEYSLWFDFFLPALEKLDVPIPLGGTSNHFVTKILKQVGGWDPFNVTEDADLGIRYSALNYVVRVVNSTTYEEANTKVGNWIRQRSRWIKGYMQTYLVHMRTPLKLYRSIGFKGFFSFQFFIGMTILTSLITPWLYSVYIFWLFTKTTMFDPYFTESIIYLSNLNLLMGNAFYVYIMMLGVTKRNKLYLIPYALAVPFYWILMSIAGYKGLYQLFVNPFYWEKTQHGLSKVTQQEVQDLA